MRDCEHHEFIRQSVARSWRPVLFVMQALRAALASAATAAPWLPRRLARQFMAGAAAYPPTEDCSEDSEGSSGGASGGDSCHSHSPPVDAEDLFLAAPGLQLLLAKSQAVLGETITVY